MTADPSTLVIRSMTEADIDRLASALGWPARGIENRYREQVEGKREVLVAEVERTPVGSVSINTHPDVSGLLHLFALDVAAAFRRRGIGAALIETVEREASLRILHGVWLDVAIDNKDARRLYERLGYGREGPIVVNRWSSLDEDGSQRTVEETCYRMFKHFKGRANATLST